MINRPAIHLTSPRGCADKPSHLSALCLPDIRRACVTDARVSTLAVASFELYEKLSGEMVYLWRPADHQREILENCLSRSLMTTSLLDPTLTPLGFNPSNQTQFTLAGTNDAASMRMTSISGGPTPPCRPRYSVTSANEIRRKIDERQSLKAKYRPALHAG